jgi:NADPH2:quinone reductase
MKAIVIHRGGGPEALQYEDAPDPRPGPGQILIDIAAAGINYSDIGERRRASSGDLPVIAGSEASGTVVQTGEGVTEFRVGEIVACQPVPGCYAEKVAAPVDAVVRLPAGMSPTAAAASMLQGRTALAMGLHAYPIEDGDRVLIHAGAGGVGLLLTQVAKMAGAFVFATVGSDAKVPIAREAGADVVINYATEDFATIVNEATNGQGVNAIYDAVGKDTFLRGLDCLASRGTMVSYGQSSGPIEPFDLSHLARSGGYVTRTNARRYAPTLAEWRAQTKQVFDWVCEGRLRIWSTSYPLAQAAEAHRALESRNTVGKQLLIPDAR